MTFSRYDWRKSYEWNYAHPPQPVEVELASFGGEWRFCGLSSPSPLGVPAGPLLNGDWCLYYASLGFDVLTYKTVRSTARPCYQMPNLQPVRCGQLAGGERDLPVCSEMQGSWAVSYGMPSQPPDIWRRDLERTRCALSEEKILAVSVVASVEPGWSTEQLAEDYARCANWAVDSGADVVETNFSCPNVATCDGQLYQDPEQSGTVAAHVREAIGNTPYIVKIGHLAEEARIEALLEQLDGRANGVATTNSIAATVVDEQGASMFDGQVRGICGEAIQDASVSQVTKLCRQIRQANRDLCVIGVGGVNSTKAVRRYLQAGAEAVHSASAAMTDPGLAIRIRQEWNGENRLV